MSGRFVVEMDDGSTLGFHESYGAHAWAHVDSGPDVDPTDPARWPMLFETAREASDAGNAFCAMLRKDHGPWALSVTFEVIDRGACHRYADGHRRVLSGR